MKSLLVLCDLLQTLIGRILSNTSSQHVFFLFFFSFFCFWELYTLASHSSILFLSQSSPKECDAGYTRMDGVPRPESTADYEYTDPLELSRLFRLSHSGSENVSMEITIGDLDDGASNPQQQQENCDGERESVSSPNDGRYENVEDIGVNNRLTRTAKSVESLGPKGLSSATSYENLSVGRLDRLSKGGCLDQLSSRCLDPEEYVEMGKRRSMLSIEGADSSSSYGFEKIEEEGHEYFVLEGVETSEGELFFHQHCLHW